MSSQNKPRVVIDTNLIVSAVITADSLPGRLLQAWKKDQYTLVISQEIVSEIKDVLQRDHIRDNYHFSAEKTAELITSLRLGADLIIPLSSKDDILLAAALRGDAEYLITGDKDLLVLNGDTALGKLKIMTAKEYLELSP